MPANLNETKSFMLHAMTNARIARLHNLRDDNCTNQHAYYLFTNIWTGRYYANSNT